MINKIILPLPPSLNHAYLTTRKGQRIMTKECRDYKLFTAAEIKKQLPSTGYPLPVMALVKYRFYFADNRKRDVPDNYSKVLRDCLKETLFTDDCWQVLEVEEFGPNAIDRDNPRVEIEWEA